MFSMFSMWGFHLHDYMGDEQDFTEMDIKAQTDLTRCKKETAVSIILALRMIYDKDEKGVNLHYVES